MSDNMLQTYAKNIPELTPEIIKKYICDKATDQEIYFFIQLCKAQNLNPFLREAYLIKYGTAPATMVVGKETFTKRADRLPQYNGNKAGLIILSNQAISYREGAFLQKGETLLGGWAEVFRKDRDHSTRIEVTLSEYEGKKADGEINQQWRTKPATMIRKVALVQGLREAFPDEFASMYAEEEGVTAVPQQDQEERRIPIAMPVAKVAEDQKTEKATESTPARTASSGNEITTGVETVTLKKGEKNGKPWTLYTIMAGEKYTTFDEKHAIDAKRACEIGLMVKITYDQTEKGRNLKTLEVLEPREAGQEG
jgi:phage recombination protein Bet